MLMNHRNNHKIKTKAVLRQEIAVTFQELIFALEKYWAKQGCVIQQPYDLEVGAGTFNPATFLQGSRAGALECRLCGTITETHRPAGIWRKSEPASALLPVPGDYEAFAHEISRISIWIP